MSDKAKPWPTHGQAVNARNKTAENLLRLMDELHELQKRVDSGGSTRMDMTLSIYRMERLVSTSLMLMIQQQAPVHPDRIENLTK